MAITPTGDIFKTLTFDSVSLRAYGVYLSGTAVFNAPEREIEMISVPGKNGDLAIDKGHFKNIVVTYPAGIYAKTEAELAEAIANLRNYLCSKTSYCKLSDDYNSSEYRMAIYKSGLDVEPTQLKAGKFNLVFECKPQRFLTSGDSVTTMTSSGTITNPTRFESKPLIEVTGTGTLTVNGRSIVFSASPTTIDCEMMEAYNGSTSRNGSITLGSGGFPVLSPGSNTITLGSGITQIKITPRWWQI